MNILDTLKQLRDDLKIWVTTNLDAINAKIDENTIPIDSELDSTSTNPIQNKVVADAINNIPRFSGDYNDLVNAPDITEDGSGNITIADEDGNIIVKIDADGLHTTAISVNGEDVAAKSYVDEAFNSIEVPEVDLTDYYTIAETDAIVDGLKAELSESIVSESTEWTVSDNDGNIILTVDSDGLETTTLTAQAVIVNGVDVVASIDSTKEYIDTKTSNMVTTTVVDSKISTHNTSTESHGDIRVLISGLATEVSNFLDVDDTTRDQLSEVLTLIDNNKGTLESLTTSKVNVSDIVNNLTTASANKVLSANQGVVLKTLIDELEALVETKADASALANYYTKAEIDGYSFITLDEIDSICGTNIAMASEVMF